MMGFISAIFTMFALPAALYFLALLGIGFFSRLAFDVIAVLSIMLLLTSWLASSGFDALVMFALACFHAAITPFARSRLPHGTRRFQRDAGSVDGGN